MRAEFSDISQSAGINSTSVGKTAGGGAAATLNRFSGDFLSNGTQSNTAATQHILRSGLTTASRSAGAVLLAKDN